MSLSERSKGFVGLFAVSCLAFGLVTGAVLIDATPQGQAAMKDVTTLTIKGVLNYQACDDKMCFTPQTVPLTWTVTVRQLDRERAKP